MSTITEAVRILIDHDTDRMACMDHDGLCCPTCDAHDMHSREEHQVHALHNAGLLRRDTEDDYGLSKVRVTASLGGPTHVLIERAGIPLVNGYIELPHVAQPPNERMPTRPQIDVIPYIRKTIPEPWSAPPGSGPVERRLRALADDMERDTPFTAAILRQFADEVTQLRADQVDTTTTATEGTCPGGC